MTVRNNERSSLVTDKIITIKNSEGNVVSTIIVSWNSESYEVDIQYIADQTTELEIQDLRRG